MREVYKPSGQVPPGGVAIAATGGVLAALVLFFPYSWVLVHIPSVWLSVLLPLGYGFCIGVGVVVLNGWGKVRSSPALAGVAAGAGSIALYLAWCSDVPIRTSSLGNAEPFTVNPATLLNYMGWLYREGSWGLFGGSPVRGPLLAVFWLGEAASVLATAGLVGWKGVGETPFCERCGEWTDVTENARRLEFFERGAVEMLLSGSLKGLQAAREAMPAATSWLQMDLARCPKCREANYVRVAEIHMTKDDKGNDEKEVNEWVPWTKVTAPEADFIGAKGTIRAVEVPVASSAPPGFEKPGPSPAAAGAPRKPYAPPPWEEGPHTRGPRP